MENSKKPDIRFIGFTGEWERRKLGELTSLITKGTTPLDKSGNGTINFVKIENINPSSGEIKPITQITCKEHEGYLKRSQLREGDILFSIAGTLGRVCAVNKGILPANTNQALAIIRLKSGCLDYITTYLKGKAVANFVKKNPTVGAQPNLSLEQVGNLEIAFPSKSEQEQIGAFFRNLDALIALHERKCERLQNVKKSMLEKMFPKKGSNVPEIRFAGFTEPWELRKLGELVDIGDIDHRMPSTVEGGIPYLMTGDFSGVNELDFSNAKLISVEDYQQLSKKIKPEKEDIIFARYASVGAVRFIDFTRDFLISYSCAIIKSGKRIVPEYLYHFLTSKEAQQQIQLGINIGSQANIGIDSMKNNIIIFMPSEAEQHIISNYLSNLDNLITLRQRELEKLKNIKKSMLEKMFV